MMTINQSPYRKGLEFIIREFGVKEVIHGREYLFVFTTVPINRWRTTGYSNIVTLSDRWMYEWVSSSDDNIYFKYKL